MSQTDPARLLRVAYFSRNAMTCARDAALVEVDRILATAQANNASRGVTGALLFNNGAFAQVLEGPAPQVEDIFDTIQIDDRHCDITVLETDWVDARLFPSWSMAFAGADEVAAADYASVAERSAFDPTSLSASDLMQLLGTLATRNELMSRAVQTSPARQDRRSSA